MTDPTSDAAHDPRELSADAFNPEEGAGLSDADLRRLLAQAHATGDEPLRRLVVSYVTLRRLTADVISFIETRDGGQLVARAPLLSRAKSLATRTP
jgi:hypothetical protein